MLRPKSAMWFPNITHRTAGVSLSFTFGLIWQLQILGSLKWIKRTYPLKLHWSGTAFSQGWKEDGWIFWMTQMIQSLIESINTAKRLSTGRDFKWKQTLQFLWLRLSKLYYSWHQCHIDNQIASFVFGSSWFVIFLLLLVDTVATWLLLKQQTIKSQRWYLPVFIKETVHRC